MIELELDYPPSYQDGFLDVTGAKDIEITVCDGPNSQAVMHITVGRETYIAASMRICRISGQINFTDTRKSIDRRRKSM